MFWFIFTAFLIAFSRSGESGTDCRSCFSGTCSEEFTSCRSDDVCGPMLSSWISEGCYDECEYFTTRFQEYQCYKWNGWSDDVTCQELIGDLATCVKNCCYDESELEDCPIEETEIMARNQMNTGMNQQVSHGHDNSHMRTQQQNTRFGRPMGTQQQGGNGNSNVRSHSNSRRLKQHTPVRIKKQRYYSEYPRYFQEHRSQMTSNNMNTNVNTRKRSRRLQEKSPQHMDNGGNVPNHFGNQQQTQTQTQHQPEPVLSRDQYTRQGQPMTTFGRRRTQHMNHMNHMQNGHHQMNTNQQRFTQKRNLQEQMYNQRQTDLSHSQMQGENNHMNVRQNNQNTLNRKLTNLNDQNIPQNPMSMSDNQGFMQQQMSNPQNTGNTNSQQSHTTEGFVQQQTQQQTQQTQGQP